MNEAGLKKFASILGRLGGLKGGPARAKSLSRKRRKEIAIKAIQARWAGHKKKPRKELYCVKSAGWKYRVSALTHTEAVKITINRYDPKVFGTLTAILKIGDSKDETVYIISEKLLKEMGCTIE